MKKLLVILVCGIVSTSTFAQSEQSTSKWFLQAAAGVNNAGTDNMSIGTLSGNIGFVGDIELGYQFNQNFGLSGQLRYVNPHAKKVGGDYDGQKYGLNGFEPSINLNVNLTNLILGYKADRKNFLNVYGGIAGAFTSALKNQKMGDLDYNDNNYALGFRAGLQYERALKNNWGLLVDAGINCFDDKYDKSKGGGLDSHLDLQIGIRKYFGVGGKRHRSDYKNEVVNVVEKHETVNIVDTIFTSGPKDMYSIFFERDKIDILTSEAPKIKAVADFMTAHPEKVVFVFGYADKNTGTTKRNEWLADNRARVIREQLINTYGIDSSRIISYHQGDTVQPFAMEEFEKNRATICVITDFKR